MTFLMKKNWNKDMEPSWYLQLGPHIGILDTYKCVRLDIILDITNGINMEGLVLGRGG